MECFGFTIAITAALPECTIVAKIFIATSAINLWIIAIDSKTVFTVVIDFNMLSESLILNLASSVFVVGFKYVGIIGTNVVSFNINAVNGD